jgi:hypothetical protein
MMQYQPCTRRTRGAFSFVIALSSFVVDAVGVTSSHRQFGFPTLKGMSGGIAVLLLYA